MWEDTRYAIAYSLIMGGVPFTLGGVLIALRKRIAAWPFGGWTLLALAYYCVVQELEDRWLDIRRDYSRPFYRFFQLLIQPLFEQQGGKTIFETPPKQIVDWTQPFMIAAAPHPTGLPLYGIASVATMYDEIGPQFKPPIGLAAKFIFHVPGLRELFLNFAVPGTRENLDKCVKAGRIVSVIPGGVAESLFANPGKRIKVLTTHTGFIRSALEHGLAIMPNFAFGQWNMYDQYRPPAWIAQAINHVTEGWYPAYCRGEYFVLPKRGPVVYTLGEPVQMPLIEHPTEEEIEIHRFRFYKRMRDMVVKMKDQAGFPDVEVEFLGLPELNINMTHGNSITEAELAKL
jgi:hypothetical protein